MHYIFSLTPPSFNYITPKVAQQIALYNKSTPFLFLIYKVFQTKEKLRLKYTTEIEGAFFTLEKSWENVLNFKLSTWHYQEAYFEVTMPRRKLGSTYHNSTWEECQLQRMDLHTQALASFDQEKGQTILVNVQERAKTELMLFFADFE